MSPVVRIAVLVAGVLISVVRPAFGQATGSIFGKVTDSSGGVLPGVTVTVTGAALQQPLTTVTQASGAYQFPLVPIGTYTVTFELASFKKATRTNVVIETGFNAEINQQLEVGQLSEEMTVTAATPVVDTKKTTTGATFSKDVLENIPTARDPWQIINMAPGVQAGLNVGGSASGQQVGSSIYGTGANVQWNLEGGSITDLSSNSSPVLLQLRLVRADPGRHRRRRRLGAVVGPVDQPGDQVGLERVQGHRARHVPERRDAGQQRRRGAVLAGRRRPALGRADPQDHQRLDRVRRADHAQPSVVVGRGRSSGHQRRRAELLRRHPRSGVPGVRRCAAHRLAEPGGQLRQPRSGAGLPVQRQDDDQEPVVEVQLPAERVEQAPVSVPERQQDPEQPRRQLDDRQGSDDRASSATSRGACRCRRTRSRTPGSRATGWCSTTSTPTCTAASSSTTRTTTRCGDSRYNGSSSSADYARDADCLWNQQQLSNRTTGFRERSLLGSYQTVRHSHRAEDRRHLLRDQPARRRPLAEVRRRLSQEPDPELLALLGRRARLVSVPRQRQRQLRRRQHHPGRLDGDGIVPYRAELYRDSCATTTGGPTTATSRTRTAAASCASTAACATTGRPRSTSVAACRRT